MTREELYKKASELPLSSGVYIMKNSAGDVVYVGKSKKLRNRVSQYFANIPHTVKTERMVNSVFDFDYILTDSETEALVLENIQIKKYLPKYNILLKDDKNYPYIKITNEAYPRLVITRKRTADGAEYFGPYSNIGSAGKMADTIGKMFALPTCRKKFPKEIGKERPCLNMHIGRCVGVCSGNISSEQYAKIIRDVRTFLKGHQEKAISSLTEKMQAASEALDFEKAASYRDTIKRIKALRERQKVQGNTEKNADVIAVYDGNEGCALTLATVRDGCFADKLSYRFGADKLSEPADLSAALFDLYNDRTDVPSQILLSFDIPDEETEILESFLSQKAGKKVHITKPKIGDNKRLCDMVLANAKEYVLQYNAQKTRENNTLIDLAKLLTLEVVPDRIESYDVSNWGDDFISTGMIVLEHGAFAKRSYRSFNAKLNKTQNDCACMAEAVERRLMRALDGDAGFLPLPDLILADGGVTQVGALKEAVSKLGLDIPVFGMVKDRHHKTRTLTDGEREISIATNGEIYGFIYRIQDEVHRFSLSRMDKRRRDVLKHSSLTELSGVGSAKAKALIEHFGSLSAINAALPEDIAKVKGFSPALAQSVYEQLQQKNGESEK